MSEFLGQELTSGARFVSGRGMEQGQFIVHGIDVQLFTVEFLPWTGVKKGTERHGVVQKIRDEWMLMAAIWDGGYLNGYMALRLNLIRHVRADRALEDFLKQRPDWPPAILAPGSTASPHSVLETAIETSSVLSIFMEEKWPRPFFVGVSVKSSEKVVKLVTIDANAKWEDGTFKVKYKDLTQISFGGDCENALWAAVGGIPASL